jgi:tetratricopeptide (TPR) repeat protein
MLPKRPDVRAVPRLTGRAAFARSGGWLGVGRHDLGMIASRFAIRLLWPILCLFQLGLLIGGYRVWSHSRPTAPGPALSEPRAASPPRVTAQAISPVPLIAELGRGDDLMRQGRYELALGVYRGLVAGAAGRVPDTLRYRIALCFEGLGRYDQAVATLRVLVSQTADPVLAMAGEVGQARIWFLVGRPAEAKNLACDLILRVGDGEVSEPSLVEDARYLLGLALAREAITIDCTDPFADPCLARATLDWLAEDGLDRLAASKEPRQPAEAVEVVRADRTASGSEDARLTIFLPDTPISAVIDRVAGECGLRAEWTAAARRQADARSTTVTLGDSALPEVLEVLTEPLALAWGIKDGAVYISTRQEVGHESIAAYRITVARRALRGVVERNPRHPWAAAAILELGNIDFTGGSLEDAAATYESLAREFPRSRARVEAFYNLGQAERRLGKFDAARRALYSLVDGFPAHILAPPAYLAIGRMFFEEADTEHAISPLRRALTLSAGSDCRPAAAVLLAAAHLVTNNAAAAAAVLRENREDLKGERFRETAGLLVALARYYGAQDARKSQREARGLLSALVASETDNLLGPVGVLLRGRAYRELGLGEQMAALYEAALSQPSRGPFAAEMTYDMAEFLYGAGRPDDALAYYKELIDHPDAKWANRSRGRLAEIAFDEQRFGDAIARCRELLGTADPLHAAETLKLMGRAYEQLGDHQRAAVCFAGQRPDP